MRIEPSLAIALGLALALGHVARADDDAARMATRGEAAEVPPTTAVAMTATPAADPCSDLVRGVQPELGDFAVTCSALDRMQLSPGVTARLFRTIARDAHAAPTLPPIETRYVVIVDDGDARWTSLPLAVSPNSVLCNRWTVPIATTTRLRAVRVDGQPAVALELRVANRANLIDPGLCATKDYRIWRRTAFLVCRRSSAWSCSAASFGTWQDPPCTASLRDDGSVDFTCKHEGRFHLGP